MKQKRANFVATSSAALLLPLILLWTGCKGDSAPAVAPATVAPPPILRVRPITGDPLTTDPVNNPLWQTADWKSLTAPLHDGRTTPLTAVATLYTPTHFYVAFVCVDSDAIHQDQAQIWLDTSHAQNGTDVFSICISPDGKVTRDWYRCSAPPEPKPDGSPNFVHPISQIPDYPLPGLQVRTGRSKFDGQPAWTLVVAIPFQGLPLPLRVDPHDVKEGGHWRANLIRSERLAGAPNQDVLQSNLAPVYPAGQQVSPYRMTEMVLEGAAPRVALDPTAAIH